MPLIPPTAYNALMGLFRPQVAPAGASAYDQALAQARSNALGQFGMGLVAAAIPQTAAQRVQSLQAALGSFQPSTTDIYNQAQARLMMQRMQSEQDAQNRMNTEIAALKSGSTPVVQDFSTTRDGGMRTSGAGQISSAAAKLVTTPPVTIDGIKYTSDEVAYLQSSPDVESYNQAKADIFKARMKAKTSNYQGSKSVQYVNYQGATIPVYMDVDGTLTGPNGIAVDTSDPTFRFLSPAEMAGLKAGATATGKSEAETKVAAPQAIVQYDTAINAIDQILADPETLGDVTGVLAGSIESPLGVSALSLGQNPKIPGMMAKIGQLQAKAFISAIPAMKGSGSLSDAEGAKLDTAEARLSRTQSTEDFTAALNEYKDILTRAKTRQQLIAKGMSKADAFAQVPESPFSGSAPAETAPAQAPTNAPTPQTAEDLKKKYNLEY